VRIFGLLGEKLSHSYSPMIHAMLSDYTYKLFEKSPGEVESFLKSGSFNGLNVTIPYKKTAMAYCDELSDRAREIGSVNTIVRREDGSLFGDNTDYFGFSYMIKKSGVNISGKKALVLGSGGAGLTVRAVLRDFNAAGIITVSRRGEDNYNNLHKHFDADILVNTTPVGMYPDNGRSIVRLREFDKLSGVFDLIFNPDKTELLLEAEVLGIPRSNGLRMLVAQAAKAAELFSGVRTDSADIDKITGVIRKKAINIILIGMPGSGKTTTGKILADICTRQFYDTDELVASRAGKSIESIFNEDGEEAFRNLETQILERVTKLSGAVIATGGGVVTRGENRRLLRQNGTLVFLNRPLRELETEGRPLSRQIGVRALYEQRLPIYKQWCDYELDCCGAQETALKIKAALLDNV
jgi:shikimate dehydrogenase